MAKVILLNGWFADGVLYRKSVTKKGPPVDIPDDVVFGSEGKSRLPSTARIVSDDYVTPLVKPGVDTFSEHRAELDANDPDRAAAVAQSVAVEKAEQNQRDQQEENRKAFEVELAAEEAAGAEGKPTVMEEPAIEAVADSLVEEVAPPPPNKRRKGKK